MKYLKVSIAVVFLCMLFPVMAYGQESEETISELGSIEEFQEWISSDAVPYSTLSFVRRVGRIVGVDRVSYFSMMKINGELAYCIEPNVYAATGQEYTVDWGKISEKQKQQLFRITNVGYGNFGHDGDEWFIATQLAIWRALGITHLSAQTMDKEPWDVSSEIAEIEWMANNFEKSASFSGQTLKMDLGIPKTITDTNGVLSQFEVNSVQGVEITQNQNQLTLTITSMNYQKSISDSKGLKTGGLVYVYPEKQAVYMVHRSAEPVSYELNLSLNTGNLIIYKQDELGNSALGRHVFEIRNQENELVEINGSNELVAENGKIELMNELPKGRYTLKEIRTVYPYELSDQVIEFEIETDQENEITFVNEFQNVSLRILKKDKSSLKLLDGAEFVVSLMQDDKWVDIVQKEAEDGMLELNDLKYGQKVKVCEVKAPAGYEISEPACQIVEMKPEENQILEIEFLNDLRQIDLHILKRDAETKELLKGAEFEISTHVQDDLWNVIKTGITDQQGLLVEGLDYGQEIKVCEIKAPEGYKLSEQPCQIIQLETEKESIEVEFENELRDIYLRIVKADEDTKELLNGVEFRIQSQSDEQLKKTGEQKLLLPESWQKKAVTLYADKEKTVSLGRFDVDEHGQIDVSHINTFGEVIVFDEEENELVRELKDMDGIIEVGPFEYGQTVEVCEVFPHEGYELPEQPCQSIHMTSESEIMEIVLTNKRKEIDVMLYKVETGDLSNRLNDAMFSITKTSKQTKSVEVINGLTGRLWIDTKDESGMPVSIPVQIYKDEACTELYKEILSDDQGELIVECEEGDYYVRIQDEVKHYRVSMGGIDLGTFKYGDIVSVCEVAAPAGFHLREECEQFEIKTENHQLEILFDNERIKMYDEVPKMGLD
ncbi:MAG: Cys-Gln thioester bond-forming surface protein [Erysipelotrichaceae bacterium]|nr:Cys-Gln thioester bond-forming surface protein [Erysipelotrichaceae bacterium]